MSKNKGFVVIDIGSSKITTLVAQFDDVEGLYISASGESVSNGIDKGVIQSPSELSKSIKESIRMAETSSGYKITSVVANISGQNLDFKTETESLKQQDQSKIIDQNDIASIINNISQRLPKDSKEYKDSLNVLHILPKKYLLDGDLVLEPFGLTGSELNVEFNIISIKTNTYINLKKIIESAGVEVIDFVANPIASSMAVLLEEEKDFGVACIDIGASLTDIAVYKNGNLEYIKSIPLGGNLITADIAYRFKIHKNTAEKLKKQFGMSSVEYLEADENIEVMSREDLSVFIKRSELVETIEWRLGEIFEIIRKEIEKSGIYDKLNTGIVITGGVANTPYIQQLAQNIFEKDVRIGKPREYKGYIDKFSMPEYATSIGLLHFVVSHNINNKNFSKSQDSKGIGFQNIFDKFFDKIKELF